MAQVSSHWSLHFDIHHYFGHKSVTARLVALHAHFSTNHTQGLYSSPLMVQSRFMSFPLLDKVERKTLVSKNKNKNVEETGGLLTNESHLIV